MKACAMRRYTVDAVKVSLGSLLSAVVLCLTGADTEAPDQWRLSPVDPAGRFLNVTVTPGEPAYKASSDGVAIAFSGSATGNQPGEPDIAGLSRMVPGRPGFSASIHVLKTEFRDQPVTNVVPVESLGGVFVDDNTYRQERVLDRNQAVYGRNEFWPSDVLRLDEAWLGTNKYIRLICNAAQYNPVTGVLRVHSKVEGELKFSPEI